MKLFITGATGFVGQEVVRQASEAGHRLRLLVRNPEASAAKELKKLYDPEISCGDVLKPQSLESALIGIDAAIHLVGIISEVGEATFENMHFRATQNVVAAARRAAISRFIHMSALGTRPDAPSRYHQTKWQAEQVVRDSSLPFTIFRPSLIYGPKDQFVNLFARMAKLCPVLPVMGNPKARFQPISVQVVAAAFVGSLQEPKSIGQTFDLCGPETFSLPEILDAILGVTGRKRLKIVVPNVIARAQAAFLEFIFPRFLGKAPPLNREQLKMLQEDNTGQGRAADELFGLKHPPFRQAIQLYLS
jgi:NADH dehydrogenase